METSIIGHDDEDVGVRVHDREGVEHVISVGWDGDIIEHGVSEYPNDAADRTDYEDAVIRWAQASAAYAVHREMDADIIPPNLLPEKVAEAITAIQALSDDEFREKFYDYYEALQDPPVDAPIDDVALLIKGMEIRDGPEVGRVTNVRVYADADGDGEFDAHNVIGEDDFSTQALHMPPQEIEWDFGERFREAIVHHLKCQIRDLYIHVGEDPPEEYAVDGYGKLDVNGKEFFFE